VEIAGSRKMELTPNQLQLIYKSLFIMYERDETERWRGIYPNMPWVDGDNRPLIIRELLAELLSNVEGTENAQEDLTQIGFMLFNLREARPKFLEMENIEEVHGLNDRRRERFFDNYARHLASIYLFESTTPEQKDFEIGQQPKFESPQLNSSFIKYIETSALNQSPASQPPIPSTQNATVIVHGTNANSKNWWQLTGGNTTFADFVDNNSSWSVEPTYRGWSGGLSKSAREQAANDLAKWIKSKPYKGIRVIAHSHGGNVAILASAQAHIDHLIIMGTPIALEYIPNLNHIGRLDNVFSTNDTTQLLGTSIGQPGVHRRGEGRTVSDNLTSVNYIAEEDGSGHKPGHSELHAEQTWRHSNLMHLI
jgi:hypothetical protein